MPRGNLRTSYNNKILNLKGCLFQMFHMKSWAATTLMLATKQWKSLKFNSQWEQTASLIKMGLLLIFKLVLQVILETFLASWHICKVSLVPEEAFISSFKNNNFNINNNSFKNNNSFCWFLFKSVHSSTNIFLTLKACLLLFITNMILAC